MRVTLDPVSAAYAAASEHEAPPVATALRAAGPRPASAGQVLLSKHCAATVRLE